KVPLDLHVEQMNPGEIRLPEVTALCRELGFTSLLREFLEQAPAPAVSAGIESEELRTPEAVAAWIKCLEARAPIAIALAVEGEEGFSATLAGLGLSDGRRIATIPLGGPESPGAGEAAGGVLGAAKAVLADPSRPKAVH